MKYTGLNELREKLKTEVTEKTVGDIRDFAEKELESKISSCPDPTLKRELEALRDQARKLVNEWEGKLRR
jgi:hypothetical protein